MREDIHIKTTAVYRSFVRSILTLQDVSCLPRVGDRVTLDRHYYEVKRITWEIHDREQVATIWLEEA